MPDDTAVGQQHHPRQGGVPRLQTLPGPRRSPLASPASGAWRGGSSWRRPKCNPRWLLASLLAFVAVTTVARWRWLDSGSLRQTRGSGVFSSLYRDRRSVEASRRSRPPPRVAVCFFGLTRSLRWTLPSVRKRLLDVLEWEGMRVDVFVHTYSLAEVNNARAGERGVDYESFVNDFQVLQPTRSLVTNQDDFDLVWRDPLSLTHYKWIYPPQAAGDIIRNVLRAYWSMSLAWGLMSEHATEGAFEYDAVVLARPDVWFHYDVNISSRMFPLPEHTVFLPSFDAEDLKGVRRNDRFAFGSVATMRVVMNRLATLLEAGAGKYSGSIDSEWVLGHHLRQHGISVRLLDLFVTRVRLTRDIPKYDHRLVQAACDSGADPVACEMVKAGFKFPAAAGGGGDS